MQITNEDFQRYLRIVMQWVSAALVSYGIATPNATWVPIAIGVASSMVTLAWTIYGNRIQAKINEVAKLEAPDGRPLVHDMKVNSVAVANAAPANVTPSPVAGQ